MSDTWVFLGPTLPVPHAVRLLPGAAYLPPVAVGDVYRLVRDARPRRVAIIDGYFERMAAVWHKEILWALEQGVAVYGAGSMGALRAAELVDFGMVGSGWVYRAYRSGRIVADDEVAVVHGPAERGYVAMSTALVDVRWGLAAARRRRAVSAATEERLLELARGMFYRDRSWEAVVDAGRAAGVPRAQLRRVEEMVARGISVKERDARGLLRRLARERVGRRERPRWRMERTWFWRRFEEIYEE